MQLSKLIEEAGLKRYITQIPADINITGICSNSKEAGVGSLFICVVGSKWNGHLFGAAAYDHGCRAFVCTQQLTLPGDACCIYVNDARKVTADIASVFYGHPSRELKIIGITGTKGKTTSALMAAHILNYSGISTGYIGTSGISYNGQIYPSVNTTPDSLVIQRVMRDMVNSGIRALVMEVSSQGLFMNRVRGIEFDTVCFTNFSPDHIGEHEHPTLEHYAGCKRKLFSDYKSDCAVFNIDDAKHDYMLKEYHGKNRISYSAVDRAADLCLQSPALTRKADKLGISATVFHHDTERELYIPMPGIFNLMNALCAIAATSTFGIPFDQAVDSLATIDIAGRFQIVDALPGSGITFVVDYAHNGASLESALLALRKYEPRRLICLFGSVGGRTQIRRKELGDVAAQLADFCILTSDNPDFEDPNRIIADIAASFKPGASCDYVRIPAREQAVKYAMEIALRGDIVLLAGKGAENFQLIRGKREPYSDRDALIEFAGAALVK